MQEVYKLIPANDKSKNKLAHIEKEAGTKINQCYQCGKCTAGCPVAFSMDYPPRQVIRLLQLDFIEEALSAESIWLCAACETCSARCPRGVSIASLMDALRREALFQGKNRNSKTALFNKSFLTWVKNGGRAFEAGLLLMFNLLSRQPFNDMDKGLPMIDRGKISFFPDRIKDRSAIKQIFERAEKLGRK